MGAEVEMRCPLLSNNDGQSPHPCSPRPAILGLQLSALVDHVARVDWSLLERIPGERGGSQQFLYGLVKGLPLEDCCKVGSCSGGSVIRSLGGEVRPENWQWMYKQMQARDLLRPVLKN
ncbi:hypothetical protein COCNU_13G000740 [Cocos nucifera]|uniref:Uncharacterized protein n=1 Tax=Cocos nucifera TaxID=13894 RepID=A0A8K0NAW2_COCNU|nr:hypothetical protein COCNU_13G000740 [Cocos nucifera]